VVSHIFRLLLFQEESVAELGDVSEGECSSIEDFHALGRRRQEEALDQELSGVTAVAKRLSKNPLQEPAPILSASKCARFSEPADDSESLIDQPLSTTPTAPIASTPSRTDVPSSDAKASSSNTNTTKTDAFVVVPPHTAEESDGAIDHSPTSLPKFKEPPSCMWTSSHAANAPSEDRSSSLVNVLLQPLPANFDSETQLPPLETEYHSLIRLNLWSVIDGHGGGSVATYASEVLLPHIAASVSRALGCAIVSRGVCVVNGQLRDANALDLDGLIKTSDRSPANTKSIRYRSPYEASDSEDEGGDVDHLSRMRDDEATLASRGQESQASNTVASIASSLLPRSATAASMSSAAASVSSVKTSVKTVSDAPIGTHSPSEVAAITRAITESFLAVDEGWINSIDPVATHQTSCQSNGNWNSGACALTVFTIQRLEWTSVSEEHRESELRGPAQNRGHDTSQNKAAARRRMLDYASRAKCASSLSTISSNSSLTTIDGRVNTSGLESEITETEGEDDDHSTDDENNTRRRNPFPKSGRAASVPKESLISAPGGCSCHCYRADDALLYTAHVGDCRAVMLGSAPPRTIKVHGTVTGHPDATDDESSHHSSDETECLSSSDHDADSSYDEDIETEGKPASAATSPYMPYMRRPARRQSRRLAVDDFGTNAPFIALPPLEGFQSVEIANDSDGDLRGKRHHSGRNCSDSSSSSSSSQAAPPPIILPPVTRPIDLTTDHSAYNPAEVTAVIRRCNNAPRAISAGVGGGIKRVAGSLAVTRALGDAYLKTPQLSFFPYNRHAPYITARPEVNCRPIVKDGDKVLVLATDGVWERANGEDVLRWVRNFYSERIAEAERRKNRRSNQSDRCSNDGSVGDKKDDERNEVEIACRKRDMLPRSPSPPTKRRKLGGGRAPSRLVSTPTPFDSQRNNSVANVIVRRVLNKVRRARNISSLHALMSLPPGRARRSKHDDITACVVDLSAFVS
jgi:serine/threonine protein phosphatase PrpC